MGDILENPLTKIIIYGMMGLVGLLFLTYFYDRIFIKKRISRIDGIMILMLLALPIYTAINANIVFGQSLLDGLLSAWGKQISIVFVIIYQFLIRAKKVSIKSILTLFVFLSWIDMASKFYLTLTLNPALLVETDMVGYNPSKGGYVFRFDATLEQLAAIFYFTSFIITKRWYNLIGFTIFMSYLLFIDKGRIDIVSVFAVMGFVMVRNLSPLNFIRTGFVLGTIATIALLIGYQVFPDEIIVLRNMLGNFVLTVVGVDTGEGSASSRFIQIGIVVDYFSKFPEHMIFGVGLLQREQMFLRFGNLFLKDIGIIGVFFAFGVVGVIALYSLFIYALKLTWEITYFKKDLYYKLTESILVMIFVSSFFNGSFVWQPGTFLTFLLFLHTFTLMEGRYKKQLGIT